MIILEDIVTRVNRIDSCYIPHDDIDKAIKGIEQSILLSRGAKEPINVLLTGEAGTGKTTACNSILFARPKTQKIIDNCEVSIIPAFYSLIPHPVTIKGVASSMLSSLGDFAPTQGTALGLSYRLGKLLKRCETQVILLDELQHLLKRDLGKTNDVKDWLKSIINEHKVPIVIVGTPECSEIINRDNQLARRFTSQYRLTNLYFGDQTKGSFRKFIEALSAGFISEVKIKSLPDFKNKDECLAVYVATGGNPADILTLFKRATFIALKRGSEAITITDYANAYGDLLLPNSINIDANPFEIKTEQLLSSLKRYKK